MITGSFSIISEIDPEIKQRARLDEHLESFRMGFEGECSTWMDVG